MYFNNGADSQCAIEYSGSIPIRYGINKGYVTINSRIKYKVLNNTFEKFYDHRTGKEAVEKIESFAYDVLVAKIVSNDDYFKKI